MRPTAIVDFQKHSNFPNAAASHPSTLVNIPLMDKVINPNFERKLSTLKLVSKNDTVIWNPLSSWLWRETCGDDSWNFGELDEFVWDNADPDYAPGQYYSTTFYCAILNGNLDKVRKLAMRGANPNIKTKERWSEGVNSMFVVLHQHYDFSKKKELIDLLIDAGVDIHAQDNEGRNILHTIVSDSNIGDGADLLVEFLALGVDTTVEDDKGRTPLDLARFRLDSSLRDQKAIEQNPDRQGWLSQEQIQQRIAKQEAMVDLLQK